jgi:prepilin-type N-terminal cleavage/methylation domain-containing protein
MNNRKGFTIIELMLVVLTISLLMAIAIPAFINMTNRAREAGVKGQVHTLQMTAEDYAAQNDGVYSDQAADLTPLLPGAGLMANVFSGADTEPRFGAAAAASGEVGIQVLQQGGVNVGYVITAVGKDPADGLLIEVSNGQ